MTNKIKRMLKKMIKEKNIHISKYDKIILIFISLFFVVLFTLDCSNKQQFKEIDKKINETNELIIKNKNSTNKSIAKLNDEIIIQSANIVIDDNEEWYYKKIPLELDKSINDYCIEINKGLQKYIYDLCQENDITYELVLAIIWRESRFETNALNYNTNKTYDSGLMQLNDSTQEWVSQNIDNDLNYKNPYDNILAGISLLKYYIDKTGNEYDGLYAYGVGLNGFYDNVNQGITTNSKVDLAYEYVNKLKEIKGE